MPAPLCWVVGSRGWLDERGSSVYWGGWLRSPKSLGTVIKMAPRFGDEKAYLALLVHWRCSPAYLEHPLFMSRYKFLLTFLSVVNVSLRFGVAVTPPQKDEQFGQMHLQLRPFFWVLVNLSTCFDSDIQLKKSPMKGFLFSNRVIVAGDRKSKLLISYQKKF